jgi:ferredoxin-type protein NapF
METEISRLQFLRADLSGRRRSLRPPWALEEAVFVERCTACGRCVEQCPQRIIRRGRGGLPQVDFRRGECTFCAVCVVSCGDGALRRVNGEVPWLVKARIGERCLARRCVVCRTCGENCEAGAIRFPLSAGAVARPDLDQDMCTGCGACMATCPVQAITLQWDRQA